MLRSKVPKSRWILPKANLGYTQISAPMDGVVISVNIEEGQIVINTQTATTILTLANLDTITVKVKISEADVMRVRPGLTAYFTVQNANIVSVLSRRFSGFEIMMKSEKVFPADGKYISPDPKTAMIRCTIR